jgi:hypothetical protein
MQEEIYGRLGKVYEGAARCKKIESMLAQMRLDKRKLEETLPELKRALAKENLDVYELETGGASSFFSSVFGKEKSLNKERAEALMARLKCRQVEKELKEINECMESLEAERKKLEGCGAEYRRLYKQKLQIMLRKHGPSAERIMELVEDINNAKSFLKEIKEAITAGKNAMRYLRSARHDLEKAESRGIYDMAHGRKNNSLIGKFVEFEKYGHIENAAIGAGIAQSAINSFKSELADIDIKISNPDMDFKTGKFVRFADIFFDSLAIDWYAQKRIEGSLNQLNMSKEDVQEKVTMLKTLEFETQRRLNELKSKLDHIILDSKPDQEELSESIKKILE